MLFINLSKCAQKRINNFLQFSKENQINQIIKNKQFSSLNISQKCNFINHILNIKKLTFTTLQNTNEEICKSKKKKNKITTKLMDVKEEDNDDVYANNECNYIEKDNKIFIHVKTKKNKNQKEQVEINQRNLTEDQNNIPPILSQQNINNEAKKESYKIYDNNYFNNPILKYDQNFEKNNFLKFSNFNIINSYPQKNDNTQPSKCVEHPDTQTIHYKVGNLKNYENCSEYKSNFIKTIQHDDKQIGNIYNIKDQSTSSPIKKNIDDEILKSEALMEILTHTDDHIMLRNEKRFCDFLWITAKSGKGGNPNYKKQRSKKLKGEGYGGHGGNVILKSKKSIYDLIKIEQKIKANDGEDFKENSRGKDGKDKIIFVPVGTIVRKRIYCQKKNQNNRKIYKSVFWYQFLNENEELLVARGGKGGISYSLFKKHDFRLPELSEKILLELELRLINDVAFIGIENSGKTSLCSSLSKYYGNINSDIYTTTIPHVSNINYIDGVQITLLDTPYLFYNAHKDKARGKRILRHIYRSKLIIYVVDVSNDKLKNVDDQNIEDYYLKSLKNGENQNKSDKIDPHCIDDENLKEYYNDTIKQIKMLRNELFLFNPDYLKKKELVVATKCDMLHKNTLLNLDSLYIRLKHIFPDIEVIGTSAKFGLGIKLLSRKIRELIYPQYILQNSKLYSKNIEDYVIPTSDHIKEGRKKLQNYELPDNIKHIYDHNYLENFDYFLKKNKKNIKNSQSTHLIITQSDQKKNL
ncbi:GTP-binding protein, putative [Plasmodium berghei]|uniref:GTP-binding protein Obg2, putative n=2 Tax=Plasmodium berghei TaxID=5821 RepID=A0A509AHN2_PLABA|nr:GTP-binding protein Obg2, putative [Plasmodium berghei ANKA]CXI23744.1 GTP-binding protein, putative [Plasmodium berghei]SCM20228.1 GTP-binding protein, putative [Plasmodium berghei]SCN23853.1 GTP-binding protein, putative [Plasmodium berghei]SCO59271.1 GTP-binding protein, putative [Plasmodium berghei]SCO60254.1 GTP-binding protein, putative [Plasmodium berghei]|eukprot:XP_034420809.1 GTP-binding protein Obg2, putative [Plasmodium berghei ANKA]